MSAIDRQNKLLLAEDWKRIYQTFRNADFQSYDFENLRRTMIDYIRTNYPEDYNDYIESSEYLALIDLIAFLGQSIAFRVDLNARENFLELAERRDSILRTARMLSYNPKRNIPGQGLLKFATIQTTENILDSSGRNLSGQVITWNDSSNANWRDQFIKVLNASLNLNQQYGNPIDKANIYGISTEQYRIEGTATDVPIYSFSKVVSSRSMTFEITSTTFKGQDYIYEEAPRVGNKLAFLYRDDGQGPSSANTGFFLNFVQGILNVGSFTILQPNTNESVDIETQGINNNDIWLYRLDQNGVEIEDWTRVPNFEGNNIIYNSLNKNIKNIYGVTTRAGDAITLTFSDGTFGNLPQGTFRIYYRISNGLSYVISPKDIRNVSISVPYISHKGQKETLNITLTLASSITNASPAETNESIKVNAPAAYYTQNRMITGEDYNISPLTVNQQVSKIKAINRSSSGISRYFDLIDPTGKYSSTNLFASDGVLYQEEYIFSTRFSYLDQADITGIIYNQIYDILDQPELLQFYYANSIGVDTRFNVNSVIYWKKTSNAVTDLGGVFVDSAGNTVNINNNVGNTALRYAKQGALIKFTAPTGYYFDTNNLNILVESSNQKLGLVNYIWAAIISINADNSLELSKPIPSNANLIEIIPKFNTTLTSSIIVAVTNLIYANRPFGLRYDTLSQTWKIVNEADLDISSKFNREYEGDTSNLHKDSSWLLLFSTDNEYYTVKTRQLRYIFESDKEIEFYFDKSNKIYDSKNTKIVKDSITVLNFNTKPNNNTESFTQDFKWDVQSEFIGIDGYFDGKKIIVTFADNNDNGVVDDPELFLKIVDPINSSIENQYIIEEKYLISEGQEDYRYTTNIDSNLNPKVIILSSESKIPQPISNYNAGQHFYFIDSDTVKKVSSSRTSLLPSLTYKIYSGRANLKFQYTHSADYETRLDPGASNIIDIFVLTKSYDIAFRQWLLGATVDKPLPPSSNELYNMLAPNLNLIKTVSDEIIFHPVNYKILFGSNASIEVQASFKVIKTEGQVVSDNDIKARVITAINQFFELENWDFGDTFYFTELSTYVMNKLAPDISNFVIVPRQSGLNFGSLFEIKSASDQLFINGATVDDIEIIPSITPSNIKSFTNTTVDSAVLTQYITSSSYGAI